MLCQEQEDESATNDQSSGATLEALPDETLIHILSFVDDKDLPTTALVSRRLRNCSIEAGNSKKIKSSMYLHAFQRFLSQVQKLRIMVNAYLAAFLRSEITDISNDGIAAFAASIMQELFNIISNFEETEHSEQIVREQFTTMSEILNIIYSANQQLPDAKKIKPVLKNGTLERNVPDTDGYAYIIMENIIYHFNEWTIEDFSFEVSGFGYNWIMEVDSDDNGPIWENATLRNVSFTLRGDGYVCTKKLAKAKTLENVYIETFGYQYPPSTDPTINNQRMAECNATANAEMEKSINTSLEWHRRIFLANQENTALKTQLAELSTQQDVTLSERSDTTLSNSDTPLTQDSDANSTIEQNTTLEGIDEKSKLVLLLNTYVSKHSNKQYLPALQNKVATLAANIIKSCFNDLNDLQESDKSVQKINDHLTLASDILNMILLANKVLPNNHKIKPTLANAKLSNHAFTLPSTVNLNIVSNYTFKFDDWTIENVDFEIGELMIHDPSNTESNSLMTWENAILRNVSFIITNDSETVPIHALAKAQALEKIWFEVKCFPYNRETDIMQETGGLSAANEEIRESLEDSLNLAHKLFLIEQDSKKISRQLTSLAQAPEISRPIFTP